MTKEKNMLGKITLYGYAEFFSFAAGGKWALLLILVLHIIINLCTIGVSIYLSYFLTHKFGTSDGDLEAQGDGGFLGRYNLVLVLIIGTAILSALVGKAISVRLFTTISKRLHRHVVKHLLASKLTFFE